MRPDTSSVFNFFFPVSLILSKNIPWLLLVDQGREKPGQAEMTPCGWRGLSIWTQISFWTSHSNRASWVALYFCTLNDVISEDEHFKYIYGDEHNFE